MGTFEKVADERQRAVAKAERVDGYKEGVRFHKTERTEHYVSVSFYRGRKWWVVDINRSTREHENRRPLTPEFWAELEPLKL